MKTANLEEIKESLQRTKSYTANKISEFADTTVAAMEEMENKKADLADVIEESKKVIEEINKTIQNELEIKELIGQTNNTSGTTVDGTVMAKLNKLLTDWTTTRAGYIDTINTNAARLTSARATKLDNIGATSDTVGTSSAGTVMGKLNTSLLNDVEIKNLIGQTGNTGGTASAGTVMAKLNKLLNSVGIKSVQRGTFEETPTDPMLSTAIKINISTITPSKTFIILNGGASSGYSGSSSAVRGYISAVTSNSFTYQTSRATLAINNGYVSYQVIEFY